MLGYIYINPEQRLKHSPHPEKVFIPRLILRLNVAWCKQAYNDQNIIIRQSVIRTVAQSSRGNIVIYEDNDWIFE